MRVSFVSPPSEYLYDSFRGDQHCQMQLLTILEENSNDKLDLSLIDLRGVKKEALIYHIPERDLYMHSVYTLDFNQQIETVKGLREIYPNARHVAGGPHVNLFPDDVLRHFDSIVIGDAEETVKEIVEDAQNGKLKNQYFQKSPIDINNYSFAKRHFVPKSSTARKDTITVGEDKKYGNLLGTTVIFSRGCPYTCAFCAIPQIRTINPRMRMKSPENITKEINYLKSEYGIGAISLHDEIGIPLNKDQAVSRLEAIAETGVKWKGQCRVDGITPELAKMMYDSGCVAMGLGVESASQNVLDMINKKINVDRSKQTIKILKENGIAPRVYLIMGLPGEPEDISKRTWDFIQETQPDSVFLHLFTPRPGTEVYDHREKFGIKLTDGNWENNNHLFYAGDEPHITFEYVDAPWGKARKPDKILGEYKDLLERIQEAGFSPYAKKPKFLI